MSVNFLVFKSGTTEDMTNVVESIRWSGRRGAACRSLQATLLDDDGYMRQRPEIDVMEGHQCALYVDGEERFQGIFRSQTQSQAKRGVYKADDIGFYLANNDDTFVYSNKTATEIFSDVCSRFSLPTGNAANTGYVIPELPKPKTSGFDVICDALTQTFESTGRRYFVLAQNGKINLIERKATLVQWVVETGANISAYSRTLSTEDLKTKYTLLSKEGTVLAEASASGLEDKLGSTRAVKSVDDTLTKAQLTEMANSLLAEVSSAKETLRVTALGNPEIIAGVCVYLIIKPLGIEKTYYVEEDVHTFSGGKHLMTLTLSLAK